MNSVSLPPVVIIIVLVVFGFLSGSTLYFYNRVRALETKPASQQKLTFNGDIPQPPPDTQTTTVDQLTKPADPKGRLSYPANVYTIAPKETLFAVGTKLGMSWQFIKQANGVTDENTIQAGTLLAIPKLNKNTDNYRLNFLINDDKAAELNRELKGKDQDPSFDPIAVAKQYGQPYFGLTADDQYSLAEANFSDGTAVVEVKKADQVYAIGLIQPKNKGEKGLWALLYIEKEQ